MNRRSVSGSTENSNKVLLRLHSTLPAELLRAVTSNHALQGYGKHFKGNVGRPSDFMLSECTGHIDDFVSHDWSTPRILKYISLSYIYNSRAAFVGSTLICTLLGIAREVLIRSGALHPFCDRGDDDDSHMLCDLGLCLTLGPCLYILLLFHWQALRARVVRNKLLFVDKLCIDQYDDEKKRQGILGLAGFLKQAKRMVVLWSPTYFSRLWCTYELATWFRFEREVSSVSFVPVEIAPTVLGAFVSSSVACLGLHVELILGLEMPFMGVTMMLGIPLATFLFQSHVSHVSELSPQLEQFSIQQTSCFCCSTGHRDPQTDAHLSCDREMVYHALRWSTFDPLETEDDACLSAFNSEVRTTLRYYVTTVLPERRLFVRYVDFLNMFVPVCWMAIDNLLFRSNKTSYVRIGAYVVEATAVFLFTNPLASVFLIRLMYRAHSLRRYAEGNIRGRLLLSFCLWGPLWYGTVLAGWYSLRLQLYLYVFGDPLVAVSVWCVIVSLFGSISYWVFESSDDGPTQEAPMQRHFSLRTSRDLAQPRCSAVGSTISEPPPKVRNDQEDDAAFDENVEAEEGEEEQTEAKERMSRMGPLEVMDRLGSAAQGSLSKIMVEESRGETLESWQMAGDTALVWEVPPPTRPVPSCQNVTPPPSELGNSNPSKL
eukprot:TRINITY_DN59581_c0_g2_i1.p1 TRINITY_DN59581_c0_g2~~TRINITY_DN59581_c0_g2_i1.p1  ORF type:complete len:657 (-),score=49.55 TRINITY_DN59581_c0_g2_i1:79-2049(-)